MEQYLTTLEEQGVLRHEDGGWALAGTIAGGPGDWQLAGALAQAQTPDTLLELMRPRVADLDDDDRALLESGAVQGRRFLSTVIVKLLDREEDEILDRLGRLQAQRHMIVVEDGEDWWSDRSSLYSFDPGVLQELLYSRYARSAYERRRRHRAVAVALEALIADDRPPPRLALLEIARHYEDAGDLPAAARRLVEVAESTFAEGADRETALAAERAAGLLRTALAGSPSDEERQESERLLSRAIVLLVLGGEPSWRAGTAEGSEERLLALVDEAKRAADANGDPALRANARYAAAIVLVGYVGLDEGIAEYRAALDLARAAGDVVGEFAIQGRLGHHLASVSLQEGWDVLQAAHALLASGALAERLHDPAIVRERVRLETMIGVAAFDLGRYDEALELLVRCMDALRPSRRGDDVAWAAAFLGQLYTALGQYEAAEATLREGIARFADEIGSLGIRGYLRALLGRLYVEWDPPRLPEARVEMAAGRAETLASGYRGTEPLVESAWAELLLAEGALREADAVLEAAPTLGWVRSEIALASLRARVALQENRVDDAVRLSTAAIDALTAHDGQVPAVRSEEILLTHGPRPGGRGVRGGGPLRRRRGERRAREGGLAHRPGAARDLPRARAALARRARLMRALVQRVARAAVRVEGEEVAAIGPGLLVLLGVTHDDTEAQADRLADKLRALRVFPDAEGRMNEPLGDREVLCVSQFTLYGDARKGNRPSYVAAARAGARGTALRAGVRAARRGPRGVRRDDGRRARQRRAGDPPRRALSTLRRRCRLKIASSPASPPSRRRTGCRPAAGPTH